MESRIKKLSIILVLVNIIFNLYAQDIVVDKNHNKNDDEVMLIQKLSWQAINDIRGYEFFLEQKNSKGKWTQIRKELINVNFKEVNLSPGKYRYKVSILNLLGQSESHSDYRYFDIQIAYQPKVNSVTPDTIYFDDIYPKVILIKGKNFHDKTIFAIKNIHTNNIILAKKISISKNGKQAKIAFNFNKVSPNQYFVSAMDPSRLKDESKQMTFKFKKPFDFYLSGGYAFTGFVDNKVFKTYFNSNYVSLGGVLRASFMFIKRVYGAFGINVTSSGMFLKHQTAYFKLTSGLLIAQLQSSYVYSLIKRRLNLDIHFGLSSIFLISTKYKFANDVFSPKMWAWGLGLSAGTSLQVYLYKKLYIELNLDHIIPFRKGFPKYIYQPSLSFGWEF